MPWPMEFRANVLLSIYQALTTTTKKITFTIKRTAVASCRLDSPVTQFNHPPTDNTIQYSSLLFYFFEKKRRERLGILSSLMEWIYTFYYLREKGRGRGSDLETVR